MKPLILTSGSGTSFMRSDFADLAVIFTSRFVWGPLPSPDELATYLAARSDRDASGIRWSDFAARWGKSINKSHRDLGLAEFCQHYETVELWFDTDPNAQLQLTWLLDHFRSYPQTIARLKLRLVDIEMIGIDRFGKWMPPAVDVTERELATARAAWQAYRAATPEGAASICSARI